MTFNKETIIQILKDPGGVTEYKSKRWANRTLIYRMLQALYARQTGFEQEIEATTENNGIGFNGADSHFLSSVAKNSRPYGNLTSKQCEHVARRLIKYARQLEDIALTKLQQQLPLCGYCKQIGHAQQDCKEYQLKEMQRKLLQQEAKQMQLMDTKSYHD